MSSFSLSHLADHALLRYLQAELAQNCGSTARLLAYLAEVDARRLYLPKGYPSMYSFCLGELHLSEDSAWKRIQAARAARRFPLLFHALADGRLHLSAVVLLAPHLKPETAEGLVAAAEHKTKSEIERLLAERFPRPDVPTRLEALAPAPAADLPAARPGEALSPEPAPGQVGTPTERCAAAPIAAPAEQPALGQVGTPPSEPRPRVAPLAPERYALQLTMGQAMHDKLRHAQALLRHAVPSGDVAQVLERALDVLIDGLEKRKFAATNRPRAARRRGATHGRHIPAAVKRAVWERAQGRCTFESDAGQRCPARERLEFDHIHAFARDGEATVSNLRLRCRAHNQLEAERTFGAGFMDGKRERSRRDVELIRQAARREAERSARRVLHVTAR